MHATQLGPARALMLAGHRIAQAVGVGAAAVAVAGEDERAHLPMPAGTAALPRLAHAPSADAVDVGEQAHPDDDAGDRRHDQGGAVGAHLRVGPVGHASAAAALVTRLRVAPVMDEGPTVPVVPVKLHRQHEQAG